MRIDRVDAADAPAVESVEPAERVETAEPTEPAEPAESVEPVESVEPTDGVEPANGVEATVASREGGLDARPADASPPTETLPAETRDRATYYADLRAAVEAEYAEAGA